MLRIVAMLDSRLKYAVAVARAGSFTAGAEAVGITQSAITKSVADLEQQIGYAIFHRTSRGCVLTEKGRDFVEQAARLLDDADELLRPVITHKDPYAGVLRIGVSPATLEWRLIEPLTTLLKAHPSIRFDISGSSFERMLPLLRNGAVDVVLGFDAAFSEWPDIRRSPVPAVKSLLFVRRDHPLLKLAEITRKDLAKFDFVSPSDSRPYGSVIKDIYESQGIEFRRRLHTVDYFPIVRGIVAASDAIGVVSAINAQSRTFQASFQTLDDLALLPPSPVCCAIRAHWSSKPAIRAFIAVMSGAAVPAGSKVTNARTG